MCLFPFMQNLPYLTRLSPTEPSTPLYDRFRKSHIVDVASCHLTQSSLPIDHKFTTYDLQTYPPRAFGGVRSLAGLLDSSISARGFLKALTRFATPWFKQESTLLFYWRHGHHADTCCLVSTPRVLSTCMPRLLVLRFPCLLMLSMGLWCLNGFFGGPFPGNNLSKVIHT
jgi:hypothetical protein